MRWNGGMTDYWDRCKVSHGPFSSALYIRGRSRMGNRGDHILNPKPFRILKKDPLASARAKGCGNAPRGLGLGALDLRYIMFARTIPSS